MDTKLYYYYNIYENIMQYNLLILDKFSNFLALFFYIFKNLLIHFIYFT